MILAAILCAIVGCSLICLTAGYVWGYGDGRVDGDDMTARRAAFLAALEDIHKDPHR